MMQSESIREVAPAASIFSARNLIVILFLAIVPLAVYQAHLMVLASVSRSLSKSLGVPVTIGSIRGTFSPSVVIGDVRIGGPQPFLYIQRVEVTFQMPWKKNGVQIRRINLRGPTFRVSPEKILSLLKNVQTRSDKPDSRPKRETGVRFALEVENGSMYIQGPLGQKQFSLQSDHIHLKPMGSKYRLTVGPTTISFNQKRIVELSALGADLDLSKALMLSRLAALGGHAFFPHAPGMGITLHMLRLNSNANGYTVEIKAKPTGVDSGTFVMQLQLDPSFKPIFHQSGRLALHNVDLSVLAPLIEQLGFELLSGRLTGNINLLEKGLLFNVDANLEFKDIQIRQSTLASNAVGPFSFSTHGAISFDPQTNKFTTPQILLKSKALLIELVGGLEVQEKDKSVTLSLKVPPTACQKLFASIPQNFAPLLQGMVLRGDLGVRGKLQLDMEKIDATKVDIDFTPFGCKIIADPDAADISDLNHEISINVIGADGQSHPWIVGPSNPDFVSLERMSPHLKAAFLAGEDRLFFKHQGFDTKQLRRAFIINLKKMRLFRGASTISQQLIKNIYFDNSRTLSRKFQEAVLTWRLEKRIRKDRILELYLNLIELGPGIHGVEQAARYYFKKSARTLTSREAAQLAILTPSPRLLGQRFLEGKPGLAWNKKLRLLMRFMKRWSNSRSQSTAHEFR